MKVLPLVSQGCRPIGEPLTVTKAESNVVYSLGARPAYEALESAFEGLSDGEKAVAKGNLFAGLAWHGICRGLQTGRFLIRNILGADPNSGAVVIGGFPAVGQTFAISDPAPATGSRCRSYKTSSTPQDPAEGVVNGSAAFDRRLRIVGAGCWSARR